jgi:uncharacterized protein
MKNWRENPWLVCLLPFVVFMLMTSLEPTPPKTTNAAAASEAQGTLTPALSQGERENGAKPWLDLGIQYHHYPLVYTAKIILTVAAMIFVWPGYRQYSRRLTLLGVAVGVIGAAVWIALATWQRQWMPLLADKTGIEWFKTLGQRSAFNPLVEMHAAPFHAYVFLTVRLIGLAVVVPVIEEFFLRGFLMRFVMAERWWTVPFGNVTRLAVIVGTAVPMLMHPQELVAALVWFSAVTWLMTRSRSIWDCVLAHGITNLLLGIYVIASGQWWLM